MKQSAKIGLIVTFLSVCGCSSVLSDFGAVSEKKFRAIFQKECKNISLIGFYHRYTTFMLKETGDEIYTKGEMNYDEMESILVACGVDPQSIEVAIE